MSVQRLPHFVRCDFLVKGVSAVGSSLLHEDVTFIQNAKSKLRGRCVFYLVVEVVKVSGEDASDAVDFLRQEGAAAGTRVYSERFIQKGFSYDITLRGKL